jgi:hypothetical protein
MTESWGRAPVEPPYNCRTTEIGADGDKPAFMTAATTERDATTMAAEVVMAKCTRPRI